MGLEIVQRGGDNGVPLGEKGECWGNALFVMRVRQESCVSLTGWVHRYDIALTLEAFVIGVVNLKSVIAVMVVVRRHHTKGTCVKWCIDHYKSEYHNPWERSCWLWSASQSLCPPRSHEHSMASGSHEWTVVQAVIVVLVRPVGGDVRVGDDEESLCGEVFRLIRLGEATGNDMVQYIA